MTKTNLGRVSLTPRGTYDANESYKRLDIFEYNGSSYLTLKDFTGIEPAGDNITTMLVAHKGDTGSVTKEGVEAVLTGDIDTHTHSAYCTTTYLDGIIGDLKSILDIINGEVI